MIGTIGNKIVRIPPVARIAMEVQRLPKLRGSILKILGAGDCQAAIAGAGSSSKIGGDHLIVVQKVIAPPRKHYDPILHDIAPLSDLERLSGVLLYQ